MSHDECNSEPGGRGERDVRRPKIIEYIFTKPNVRLDEEWHFLSIEIDHNYLRTFHVYRSIHRYDLQMVCSYVARKRAAIACQHLHDDKRCACTLFAC